jgi:hypothetical protein
MTSQSYKRHVQVVPGFHFFLFPVVLLTWIGAGVNLYHSLGDHQRLYSASLIFVLTFAVLTLMFFARIFALKAQDRAIRAEENLRHFVLTGKLLDPRIGIRQVIALRFAPDDEFPALAQRAAAEGLAPDAIKQAVRNWRADLYRV